MKKNDDVWANSRLQLIRKNIGEKFNSRLGFERKIMGFELIVDLNLKKIWFWSLIVD